MDNNSMGGKMTLGSKMLFESKNKNIVISFQNISG
jgi:hypothetical protein